MCNPSSKDGLSIEYAVRTNLAHFQNWSDVVICEESLEWEGRTIKLVSGIPSEPLSNGETEDDGSPSREFLLPVSLAQYKAESLTIECLDHVFDKLCNPGTKRIILSIVNDDGTIVFYFMYKGVHKPKKN
ncbi:similar to Saccharomyces cerevisiae YMR059W SEN15 Subunit of the tRNA splicing endonuclease, which is composed of Sen2p, Sen15p, Sen34p, and Sen54p [Maudiozyma barnettii]|uniref:Similar to Saccharomyces cerevisiae YMR059W SEN15 Subunit of the tRNA splicing endonuclease, which is composed of Sen2p, Sen15p, Sen34p, and Sen54p n=1 Tax=Maudiozyma barnettii TaxID=61262 RepID=A0A8H2ZJW7_9SACH|nr:Sen15p [Kazachstania barnettii]CAB4256368.1 similar to Saccharomyces cerevisiae YMR059W SEN15 Subunit of the tRNA splicing endonuclease, which is composed of Sen2p, Sen15p, Sen34p, and Sen54p [Kazachstania barnettii]CAD1784977.1 similar to Saccharomyces cerevisiae YMR059W SEN15 Subunit of the tRNA splicing endonuclease, which is composed of Sen2p, Sen15p, Sen34p, and Sen54p [Kazachstania barnettii]